MSHLTVAAHTLGCKVNQCDTDAVLARLAGIGCNIGNFNESADVYIINTCTVTHASDKKSRQIVRRAKKQNPNSFVAICGCMAKNDPHVAHELGVDFIFDARNPNDFIDEIVKRRTNKVPISQRIIIKNRTRAFVKIQDGCNRFCSYCIVPYVRGNPISRPITDIVTEIESHIENGVQEIVLTGIQVASYGEDFNSTNHQTLPLDNDMNENLPSLIDKISKISSLRRMRLSSIEPHAINSDFVNTVANSATLCDHFHLSLQSGCDATLDRMNRRYTTAEYTTAIEQLRNIRPNAAFTTDIIVGFPGETDDEFNRSLDFVRKMGFSRIHVFEYSPRQGTPAANFENQIHDRIKTERSKKMRDLSIVMQQEFFLKQIGTTQHVLFETQKLGKWHGHTSNYCPVAISSDANLTNSIHKVAITGYDNNGLIGTI